MSLKTSHVGGTTRVGTSCHNEGQDSGKLQVEKPGGESRAGTISA